MITISLEEIISKKLENINDESERKNALAVLTSTDHSTFYRQKNKELLEIALIEDPKKQETTLKNHTKKYFWMLNNFDNLCCPLCRNSQYKDSVLE